MPDSAPLPAALAHAERLLAIHPDLAETQAREILRSVPGHPQAQLLLGIALLRQGDAAAACGVLSPLALAQPSSALTFQELGRAHAALGETQEAEIALRNAIRIKRALPAAWRALAEVLRGQGRINEADAAIRESIQASVADPRLIQAAAFLRDGKLPEAEHLLRAHLRQEPNDVAAMRMLAEAGTRLGRYEDAEALLIRCLDLAPGFTAARHNLAIVLFRQNRALEAVPHVKRLLEEDPKNAGYRNLLAGCMALLGDSERAAETYAGIVAMQPKSSMLWLNYGHTLRTAGRAKEAAGAYRKAIALQPSFGDAYWSLANMKTVSFGAAELATMQACLEQPALSVQDRLHLHYALGRALEMAQDYACSFAHYAEGARLRRAEIQYRPEEITAQMQRARETLTRDFFAERQGQGCLSPAPIFIVGLPRSGSTLIEQILASHSAVEGTMELPELPLLARSVRGEGEAGAYVSALTKLDAETRLRLGETYLQRAQTYRHTERPFFIDKLPNNFVHTGLLALILPRAKIIDARRGAMATCFSAFKQHFARGQHFSYELRELGLFYRDYTALMAHYDEALPGHVYRVSHEALVEDTENEIRRLLDYCGLPFEDSCLRFWETPRAVRTASSEQVRRPISREGLEQWRNYEAFLDPLKAALEEE